MAPSFAAPDLETVVGYLLSRAHYVYHSHWANHFADAETPITSMQSGVLMVLGRHPQITQSALARMMGVESPTMFNLLAKLEQFELIERIQDEVDKRAQLLQLTPAGHDMLRVIGEVVPERDETLLADMNSEERALLSRFLTQIIVRGNAHLGITQGVVAGPTLTLDQAATKEDKASASAWREHRAYLRKLHALSGARRTGPKS